MMQRRVTTAAPVVVVNLVAKYHITAIHGTKKMNSTILIESSLTPKARIRIVLFIFFVPWMAVIWYLATRFTTTTGAAVVTLLCIIWSVPIYRSEERRV